MIERILVIGGTGRLGEPVARRLQAEGFKVRVLTRSAARAREMFADPFELAQGDIDDPAALAEALRGCQGVHISIDGRFEPDLERRSAVNTIAAAQTGTLERITYLSGASVCQENTWYAGSRAKLQAEDAIRASGIPYTIFRCHYFMEVLPNFHRSGMMLRIGRHPQPYYWLAAADFARMVACACHMPEAANKTLVVLGPQALTMRQALAIYKRAVDPAARDVYMPIWVARIFAGLTGRKTLQAALPFFAYCEKAKILVSAPPDEANRLLGAPAITLEQWADGINNMKK